MGDKKTEQAILEYVKKYPAAKGNVQEIGQYWLGDRKVTDNRLLRLTLEELVRKGKLRKQRRRDGEELYSSGEDK
jgi:hypothetical protein